MGYKLTKSGVQRLADLAWIPNDPANTDWQEYQKWLAAGNTPLPADPEPTQVPQATLEDVIAVLPASQKAALDARVAAKAGK